MGQSLRVEVRRPAPLSDEERTAVRLIIDEFGVEDEIERFGADPDALNWESFFWSDEPVEGVVFRGSTRLPDVTMSALFVGIEHWGRMLGRIRAEVLPDAEWDVNVDGDTLAWNEADQRFGKSPPGDIDWDLFD